jgi:hypothetical protein
MQPTTTNIPEPSAVSGCAGYFALVTPGAGALVANGKPCDAVYVSVDAQVTGKRGAIGVSDTATQGPLLAAGIPHALSFYSILSVTNSASVWAIWYNSPL